MTVRVCDRFFVGGEWVSPVGGASEFGDVVNPATEEVIARVAYGTAADVDAAVAAARAAFPSWSQTTPKERAELLGRVRDTLAARSAELAETISREMGAPLKFAKNVQVGTPLAVLGSYVDLLDGYPFEEKVGSSLVVRTPVGVVGAITPWNYPLHQVMAKLAAALAAGCTVVLKPTEIAPLSAFALMDVFADAGLPPGVVNLGLGTGPVVGEAIAAHPGIDMVSFTGSTRAGKRVMELAAQTVKKVALELGGKSANVILPDVDGELLAKAVKVGLANCFLNSGQTCTAWTRMLVPAARYDEVVAIAAKLAAGYTLGDPLSETTRLGPLVSAGQRERVRGYIESALAEGARVVVGGAQPPVGLDHGWYVQPTLLADVRPGMRVEQEEIFGPVLSVIAYRDEAEALQIANDTVYGLAGAVWSADTEHAIEFAKRMRTGQVDVNGGRFNPIAPFGGFRQSGIGRELGAAGLEEFLELQALQL